MIVDNNHLHYNPYPNVTGPGQPQLCEAGNETYVPGKAVIGNAPASDVSNNREITSRETDLFGEKYPAATLQALGIAKAGSPRPKPRARPRGRANEPRALVASPGAGAGRRAAAVEPGARRDRAAS